MYRGCIIRCIHIDGVNFSVCYDPQLEKIVHLDIDNKDLKDIQHLVKEQILNRIHGEMERG